MTDKVVNLLSKSFLMQWVGNYPRSKTLVHLAWDDLKEEEGFKSLELVEDRHPQKLIVLEKHLPEVAEGRGEKVKKKQKKKQITKTREELIVRQTQHLLNVAERHLEEGDIKDINESDSIYDPITTNHSERLSCLIIQSDLHKLEVRVVVNNDVLWEVTDVVSNTYGLEGAVIEIHPPNSHEIVIDVTDKWIFGTIHFSSMGIGEAIFYECYRVLNKKARLRAAEITKQLAMEIYGLK